MDIETCKELFCTLIVADSEK